MNLRHQGRRSTPLARRAIVRLPVLVGFVILLAGAWWARDFHEPIPQMEFETAARSTMPAPSLPQLTDQHLQTAADELLAAVDPHKPENLYFSAFAREKLGWMVREHKAGRLQLAFFNDTSTTQLPADVLMAAWPLDGMATIFISKPGLTRFLIDGDATVPPFTPQQKNDFALALVHETVHLQNPHANPRDPESRAREESRAWRDVTLQVVRDLLAHNQPVHQRFRDVDHVLRSCNDQLPCPSLGRLVRLGL